VDLFECGWLDACRCTTWTMKVTEGGKTHDAVIIRGPNVNPGYKLVGNTQYPEIAADYERQFRILKSLPCDIFLGARELLRPRGEIRALAGRGSRRLRR
jgi:hypothetical protein